MTSDEDYKERFSNTRQTFYKPLSTGVEEHEETTNDVASEDGNLKPAARWSYLLGCFIVVLLLGVGIYYVLTLS
jgi:hypothetical protein